MPYKLQFFLSVRFNNDNHEDNASNSISIILIFIYFNSILTP